MNYYLSSYWALEITLKDQFIETYQYSFPIISYSILFFYVLCLNYKSLWFFVPFVAGTYRSLYEYVYQI